MNKNDLKEEIFLFVSNNVFTDKLVPRIPALREAAPCQYAEVF